MVAVQVRDEHGAQFQRVDPAADQLLLHPLARIDQIYCSCTLTAWADGWRLRVGLAEDDPSMVTLKLMRGACFCSLCVIRFTLRGSG